MASCHWLKNQVHVGPTLFEPMDTLFHLFGHWTGTGDPVLFKPRSCPKVITGGAWIPGTTDTTARAGAAGRSRERGVFCI